MLAKRPLVQTGLALSLIGLGTVKLGRNQGVKYPHSFTIPDDRQATALLDLASGLGVNLLDTAPAYGNSEERLGQLLGPRRKDWLICSKVGEEFEHGQSSFNFSPEHTLFSVERSLRRLNTDYLDMVLVHSDGNDLEIIHHWGTLDALAALKADGKIRAFGMSTKTVAGGIAAAAASDCVMVTWNLAQSDEKSVVDYCLQHHKGALIKKALASGHATEATAQDSVTPAQRPLGERTLTGEPPSDSDPISRSLKMLFSHPGVTSAIVGTINPDHLRYNIDTAIKVTTTSV